MNPRIHPYHSLRPHPYTPGTSRGEAPARKPGQAPEKAAAATSPVAVTSPEGLSRAVSEREVIDPESATVISEERLEESGEGALSANSSVRNYELSRSRERSEKSLGEISYLSLSVVLNYQSVAATDGEEEAPPTFEPYAEEELTEIETLVKNTVGFQPERGDRFAIHQTRFDTSGDAEVAAKLRMQRQREQLQVYLRYGLMALALLATALLLRSATRKIGAVTEQASQALLGHGAAG